MNLGATAMVAATQPKNLVHVVFDNGVYASTGNEPAVSQVVPLEQIAAGAGDRSSVRAGTPAALAAAFSAALEQGGPAFILAEIEVERGPFQGGRVTHTPEEMRDRFAAAIRGEEVSRFDLASLATQRGGGVARPTTATSVLSC
jgi:thiamine pyrophosphate-dependent acetolactate synthase large subunit-like protein